MPKIAQSGHTGHLTNNHKHSIDSENVKFG